MYRDILQHIKNNPNITLITANQRLSGHLLKYYANLMENQIAWAKPQILSLQAWLERHYLQAVDRGHINEPVLNSLQQYMVWHDIISQSNDLALLRTEATIYSVQQAWTTLQQWNMTINENIFANSIDTQTFYHWANQFEHYCKKNQVIDNDRIIHRVINVLKKGHIKLPQKMIFIGFVEFTPSQQHLIETLHQAGCETDVIAHAYAKTESIKKICCNNNDNEIEQMVRWALLTAQQQPNETIACIIPNLNEVRPDLVKYCDDLFPDSIPYNISGGESLAQHSMVQHALILFKLCFSRVDFIEVSQLLRLSYLKNAEIESDERVLFEIYLRQTHHSTLSLSELLKQCCYYSEKNQQCIGLLSILDKLNDYQKNLSKKNSSSTWIQILTKILNIAGWPGDSPLDSEQYQRHQTMQTCIQQFASLDYINQSLNFSQVFRHLKHHISNTLFQKQSEETHVYFLGLLEAVGAYFDWIWMAQCDDRHWPAPASPNPFLPIEWQRSHSMPHADAKREYYFSQNIMEILQNSCQRLYYSYPKQQGDQEILPSPLISRFPNEILTFPDLISNISVPEYQFIADTYAKPIDVSLPISGGAQLLKSQAACPFQAFARYRLNANALESPQTVLTSAQRGNISHEILENLWGILKSQKNLLQMPINELQSLIKNTVYQSLENFKRRFPQLIKPYFFQLEHHRICQIIENWLNYEKKRLPFTVIATEANQTFKLADCQLQLKVDRIDRVNEHDIIIDYKTGMVKISDWESDRPNEPQLPLYAISQSSNVQGIAFAQIRSDEYQFKGITTENITLLDCFTDDLKAWQERINLWQEALTNLVMEYAQGFAAVDPKSIQSCLHCDLHLLCRIHQQYEEDEINA